EMLVDELRKEGTEALGYHGDLPLIDRDRQVARFRDPEGPRVLVCAEVGGEGRNFQFAHHLVNYDLPWSPAAVHHRIGSLHRIGSSGRSDAGRRRRATPASRSRGGLAPRNWPICWPTRWGSLARPSVGSARSWKRSSLASPSSPWPRLTSGRRMQTS